MPKETKSLPVLLLIALAPVPSPASPPAPPQIRIVPHLDPAGARPRPTPREEESRRAALRPALAPWCRAYAPVARPLHAALGEAWDSLEHGWGPASRNLGVPVREALRPVAALPPLPDPVLDRQLRQALLYLKEGVEACTKGMPMTTRLRWAAGLTALSRFESSLAAGAGGGDCAVPAAATFTVVLGEEVGDPYGPAASTPVGTEPSGPGRPSAAEGQESSAQGRTRQPRGARKHSPPAVRPPHHP